MSDVAPGTEVLQGGTVRIFERWEFSPGGGMYLVYWRGHVEPAKFQGEPWLTVWPAKKPDAT